MKNGGGVGGEYEISDFCWSFFSEVLGAVVWIGMEVNSKPCYTYRWIDGKAHVGCGYDKNDVDTSSRLATRYNH